MLSSLNNLYPYKTITDFEFEVSEVKKIQIWEPNCILFWESHLKRSLNATDLCGRLYIKLKHVTDIIF